MESWRHVLNISSQICTKTGENLSNRDCEKSIRVWPNRVIRDVFVALIVANPAVHFWYPQLFGCFSLFRFAAKSCFWCCWISSIVNVSEHCVCVTSGENFGMSGWSSKCERLGIASKYRLNPAIVSCCIGICGRTISPCRKPDAPKRCSDFVFRRDTSGHKRCVENFATFWGQSVVWGRSNLTRYYLYN